MMKCRLPTNTPAVFYLFLGVCCTALLNFAAGICSAQGNLRAEELGDVENYLAKLGLESQLINLWEDELAIEPDAIRRKELATRIANRYGELLLRGLGDPIQVERAENLIQVYPGIDAPVLAASLLQSRFLKQRTLIEEAWQRGEVFSAFEPGELESISKDLVKLEARVRKQEEELRRAVEVDRDNPSHSKAFQKYSIALLYSQYLKGWLLYYRAVCQVSQRADLSRQADHAFRDFFEIDPDLSVLQLKRQRFQGEDWEQSALLGWAATAILRGKRKEAEHLFNLAKSIGDARRVYRVVLETYGYAMDFEEVAKRLQANLKDLSMPKILKARLAHKALQMSCQSNLAQPQGVVTESKREVVFQLAFQFLLRQEQADVLKQCSAVGCFRNRRPTYRLAWKNGLVAFFESQDAPMKLEVALREIHKAIEMAAHSDAKETIALQLLFGKILLRNRESANAIQRFTVALKTAREVGHVESEPAVLWWLGQAYKQVPGELNSQSARQQFRTLIDNYPDSIYFHPSRLEELRLASKNLPRREALRRYMAFETTQDLAADVQFDRMRIQYQVATDSKKNQLKTSEDDVRKYLREATAIADNEKNSDLTRLKALLSKLDFQFRFKDCRDTFFEDFDSAEELAKSFGKKHAIYAEWLFIKFRVAEERIATDRTAAEIPQVPNDQATELANQLLTLQRVPPARLRSVLIFLIKDLEEQSGVDSVRKSVALLGAPAEDL